MNDKLEFSLEHKLKLINTNLVNTTYKKNLLYALNRNGKYLFVFNNLSDEMITNDSYLNSVEYKTLEKILQFIEFDMKNICVTSFLKLNPIKESIDKNIYYNFYEVFLFQLMNSDFEYIILIGEDLAKHIFYMYLNNMDNSEEMINNMKKYDFIENMDKVYDFFGKKIVVIYDMKSVYSKIISKNAKQKMVDILNKIK